MKVLALDITIDAERMFRLGSFFRKVEFTDSCWLWMASTDSDGYGKWQIVGTRRKIGAHRFAYEQLVGPIPTDLVLDHLCRVRHCVNPAHLEPCTPLENVARSRGYNANAMKTHCPSGHSYSEENTYLARRSNGRMRRRCRICMKKAQRRRYEGSRN